MNQHTGTIARQDQGRAVEGASTSRPTDAMANMIPSFKFSGKVWVDDQSHIDCEADEGAVVRKSDEGAPSPV